LTGFEKGLLRTDEKTIIIFYNTNKNLWFVRSINKKYVFNTKKEALKFAKDLCTENDYTIEVYKKNGGLDKNVFIK